MHHKLLRILIGVFLLIILAVLFIFASSKFTILWPKYNNTEYGFSLKHPLFLGHWSYVPVPGTFSDSTNCNNEFPPPSTYYEIYLPQENDLSLDDNFFNLQENSLEEYHPDRFKFIYGSGECEYGFSRRLISLYVYENLTNIPFDKFTNNSYKIYKAKFDEEFGEPNAGWDSWFEVEKIKLPKNNSFIFQVNPPKTPAYKWDNPRYPIYYQQLPDGNILIITSNDYATLTKMIPTVKAL